MNIHQLLARVGNSIFRKFGYEVGYYSESMSLHAALSRVSSRALDIQTVIDVGASDGRWAKVAMTFFPQAAYLLIDANKVHLPKLEKFKNEHRQVDFVIAAAGDTVGEIYFDNSDPLGGLASHEPLAGSSITVPVTTVDTQVQAKQLSPPFLLKLDTHGFEVPIFEGAQQTLQKANLIVVEVYNFQLTNKSLHFAQMCNFLQRKGFRPIDMCSPLHRPKDKALWQFDLFFVRADRPEFQIDVYDFQ